MNTNDIRREFLDFFVKNGHREVASSALVPSNDPSLMFTNSGMVQFKDIFTGQETRSYKRATTAQKSVRAGGKHNDLENVGYTARHHTFFEMLGNFSFGDYFKEQAIEYAWSLITKHYGLPAEKLLVTVYGEDEDAATLWRKIAGLDDRKIIRINTSDNFWQMGDTGPCGPCSEIFYDHGAAIAGGPPGSADEDGDRFIEIWNLVFMQYEQFKDGTRTDLPTPSIDTGMGLERITAILQNVHSNYDIDVMRSLIEASAELTHKEPDGKYAASHKVIADHLRSSAFLIADGVLPSNEGRGYVLRRIMRRAMRHAHILGAETPLLYRLLPRLIDEMGGHYQELIRAKSLMEETLKLEETQFKQTLARGLKMLKDATNKLGEGETLPGNIAFMLYDTCGFPVDLTADIMRQQGRKLDMAGFDAAMQAQREKARASWSGSGDQATDQLWYGLKDQHGASEFLGYGTNEAMGKLQSIIVDGAVVDRISKRDDMAILLANQSPFYGESGGQSGDQGVISNGRGGKFIVKDTQKKLDGLILHLGNCVEGEFTPNDDLTLQVDHVRRAKLAANHSVTHLAHKALRQILGDHVTQKGSLVAADQMRFDFSHSKPIADSEITQIEGLVNDQIRGNHAVTTRLMDQQAAIEAGALALFGEKYGDEVRVVSMGSENKEGQLYSTELCGGTHVKHTGDIGLFKIIAEQGVASGVRRIECLTGGAALDYLNHRDQLVTRLAAGLKVTPDALQTRVDALYQDKKTLEREMSDLKRKLAAMPDQASSHDPSKGQAAQDINGIQFIGKLTQGLSPKDLKPLVDQLKTQIKSGIVAVAAVNDGKASLVVGVTDDLTDRFDAVALVRQGAAVIGGKGGGGRADIAQAGGPDADQAQQSLKAIEQAVLSMAKSA
ncbi:MAG: alanine--tRNA ligase [Alphaproteobacteria bacterium]